MMPFRFQFRRVKGWRKPPNSLVVTQTSRYGNPFKMTSDTPEERSRAVAMYRAWITSPEQAKLLARARRELRGLNLGCTCPVGLPCHVDVLLELVNQE